MKMKSFFKKLAKRLRPAKSRNGVDTFDHLRNIYTINRNNENFRFLEQ